MKNNIEPEQNDKNFHFKLASMTNNTLINFISKAILLRPADNYILIPWDKISDEQKLKLVESHENIIAWITNKINPTIIIDNPITNHYTIADEIIEEKNELYNDELLEKYTISDLLKMGITDEKINDIIRKIRNQTKT